MTCSQRGENCSGKIGDRIYSDRHELQKLLAGELSQLERKKGRFFAYQTRSLQYLTVELRDGIRRKQVRNGFCRGDSLADGSAIEGGDRNRRNLAKKKAE